MSFFNRIKQGLKKTKESVSRKFFEVFKAKELNAEFYEDLELTMISADMGVNTTKEIIEDLKIACFKNRITQPQDAREELKKIALEYIEFIIPPYTYPLVLMLVGVNGVGKTTAIAKLAKIFTDDGKTVILAAADTFRAAASEQLEVWANRVGVRMVKHSEGSDPAAVVFDALSSAKARNIDVVLIDTAGRLHNKKNLMAELSKINRVVLREMPDADHRNYIVLDATLGQNARSQVDVFNEMVNLDGIILTKLDGTAKGGVVLPISNEEEIPVVYVGVGEKITDLLKFSPKDFIDEIFS